jgi:hypothetical protein
MYVKSQARLWQTAGASATVTITYGLVSYVFSISNGMGSKNKFWLNGTGVVDEYSTWLAAFA